MCLEGQVNNLRTTSTSINREEVGGGFSVTGRPVRLKTVKCRKEVVEENLQPEARSTKSTKPETTKEQLQDKSLSSSVRAKAETLKKTKQKKKKMHAHTQNICGETWRFSSQTLPIQCDGAGEDLAGIVG